jgi:hypothetical protein
MYRIIGKQNRNNEQTPKAQKASMKNDLDCMQTVQCKSIEPANTNIHSTTHTPSRLQRTNITERTTPHNAKACRQMEASSNADSASLGMKIKPK